MGIGDAFCQVDALAPAIVAGLNGSGGGLDARMERWGRWRDREFAEHYWFADDLGKAGRAPAVLPQIARDLHAKGQIGRFQELFSHRTKPSRVRTRHDLSAQRGDCCATAATGAQC